MPHPSLAEKATAFKRLHQSGTFLLPNAWDPGSARLMAAAGYPAVATTSAGIAFAQGLPDGERIGFARMLEVVGAIADAVPVPVTADMEGGYGAAPEAVARAVWACLGAGIVGCNIEDSDPATRRLLPFDAAVERVRAGAAAAAASGVDFVLNARADPYLVHFGDAEANFAEAVRRARAYLAAGAGCIFVPGPNDAATIGRLVAAIPGPLNIMVRPAAPFPPLPELTRLGLRRVSLGGSLMLAAYGHARRTLESLRQGGAFDYAADAIPHAEMVAILKPAAD